MPPAVSCYQQEEEEVRLPAGNSISQQLLLEVLLKLQFSTGGSAVMPSASLDNSVIT